MLDITDIAAVDNLCHLPLEEPPPLQAAGLARFFTEASIPEVLDNQTLHSLFFRRAIRDLGAILGFNESDLEDSEGNLQVRAVLAKRAEFTADDWFRLMLQKANLTALFADMGYPRSGGWTIEKAQNAASGLGKPPLIRAILRIERVFEDLMLENETFNQCEEAFREIIRQTRQHSAVGLKSIIAYRCGLDIKPEKTSKFQAGQSFLKYKSETWRTGAYARIADKTLLDYLVPVALDNSELDYLIGNVKKTPGRLALRVVPWIADGFEQFGQGAEEPVFAAAQKYGVPVFVLVPGRTHLLEPYLKKFPGVQVIIDHCGVNISFANKPTDPFEGFEQVFKMAQYPNVALKWAHAPSLSSLPYSYPDLIPVLVKVVEAFGPERVMWASDHSHNKKFYSWAESLFYIRDTKELSESDKIWLLGKTARTLLKWPQLATITNS